jgi:hypothetical protein
MTKAIMISLCVKPAEPISLQPKGLAERSRGLSEATPPVNVVDNSPDPGGVEEPRVRPPVLAPLRGAEIIERTDRGYRSLRVALPPATFFHPSGMIACADGLSLKAVRI